MTADALQRAEQLFVEALAHHQRGSLARAGELYEAALGLAPGRSSVMNNLATVYFELGKFADARSLCERVLQAHPEDPVALLNLGNCQLKLGSTEEALASYERSLAVQPRYAEALNSRGNALAALGRLDEALASYDEAVIARPGYAEALNNRGSALLEARRLEEALASYDRALAIRPDYAEALYDRGNVLLGLGRLEASLASYDRALELKPDFAEALNNRGIVLLEMGRREALIDNYRRLLAVAPEYPYIGGFLLNARLQCCEWDDYDSEVARITRDIRAGKRADAPFNFLAVSDSPADQLCCAKTSIADEFPSAPQPAWEGRRVGSGRIRVAYLSADFHDHAVPRLIAGLIESHDRSRFEVTALSLGPERNDAMRERLKRAFDRFVDVRERSDRETASLLDELGIDIAVDLQGFTRGCRPGILAHRGAPIQVNYLGYPGTMGADYVDYIIGDRHVIPQAHHPHYSEKVVYLPDCYQVNDPARAIADRTIGRAALGLPESGFVFCCFNNSYKITPRVFDIWMRVLQAVGGSVLWLLEDNPSAARNLLREAGRRGVAPERLIFAPRTRSHDHLARHRAADLFLDTLPYNAHVTASDALWAGLPVLTRMGDAFAGRVAASLLHAAGVPELVTTTWQDYERLALELAGDRGRLDAVRDKLARNRLTCPLFDLQRLRKHLEAAYVTMRERHRRGDAPVSFEVSANT